MRQIYNFNTKWAFSKEAEQAPTVMPEKWYWVSLPHTWNDIDGQDGGNDLYRGTAFYAKELEKIDLPKADKYFLEFNGANSSAKAFSTSFIASSTEYYIVPVKACPVLRLVFSSFF